MLAQSGVYPDNPKPANVALTLAPGSKRILAGMEKSLMGNFKEAMPCHSKTLCGFYYLGMPPTSGITGFHPHLRTFNIFLIFRANRPLTATGFFKCRFCLRLFLRRRGRLPLCKRSTFPVLVTRKRLATDFLDFCFIFFMVIYRFKNGNEPFANNFWLFFQLIIIFQVQTNFFN